MQTTTFGVLNSCEKQGESNVKDFFKKVILFHLNVKKACENGH